MESQYNKYLKDGVIVIGKVGIRVALNTAFPAYSAGFDFLEAGYDYCNGDYIGASINVGSGLFSIATAGIWGACKDGAKEVGKEAAKDTTKKATKEATKKFGKEASKKIAKGMSKSAAVSTAKSLSADATKELAKNFREVVGKQTFQDLLEEAAYKATKKTVPAAFAYEGIRGFFESGGTDIFKNALTEGLCGSGTEFFKRVPKQTIKCAIADSAKNAAIEYLEDWNKTIMLTEIGKTVVKGGLQYEKVKYQEGMAKSHTRPITLYC